MQRYALLTLWFGTGGDSWRANDGWLFDIDECTWVGVSCYDTRVSRLGAQEKLAANNLVGSISADIALLTGLLVLDWSQNPGLSGTIPASMGNLVGLETFVTDGCAMTGFLPSVLGNLSALIKIILCRQ